jgi:hypothetical protein
MNTDQKAKKSAKEPRKPGKEGIGIFLPGFLGSLAALLVV